VTLNSALLAGESHNRPGRVRSLAAAGSTIASAMHVVPLSNSVLSALSGDVMDAGWRRCRRDRWGRLHCRWGAGATGGVGFAAGEPMLLRWWRISGDVPGRCREFPPFAEAPAPFASSSSRSPRVEFGPSNAPSAHARRPSSMVSYEQSFFVPLTDAPMGLAERHHYRR
jgi:hypothetical protein